MNTAITVPKNSLAKIDKMVPKPTKTEIINAMVERARVKHELDERSRKIKADALEKKILAAAKKGMKNGKCSNGSITTYREDRHVSFRIEVKTTELSDLIEQWTKINRGSGFDAAATKNAIRQKLNGEPPKIALLDNPEAVKAIDAKLEEWSL